MVLNVNEHLTCGYYVSDYKIGFNRVVARAGDKLPLHDDYHHLFFIRQGSLSCALQGELHSVGSEHLFFLPAHSAYMLNVDDELNALHCLFNRPIDLCETLALEQLAPYVDHHAAWGELPHTEPFVARFVETMADYLDEGIECTHFHEIKLKELFYLLRYFYTKKEIASLFAPIIGQNIDFKDKVMRYYKNANSVKELASLCNYSLSSFKRVFKEHFAESPYEWIQKNRIRHITGMLRNKDIPLSQIINDFGFSSTAHFTIYCKKHLQQTPTQYRKEHTQNFENK